MFFRLKKSGERAYVQIVENKRIEGAVRQSVVATLGRADELEASGALASLLASGAKLTEQVMLITALDEDEGGALAASAKRLGGPLLFGRIWARLGIPEVLADLLADCGFEVPSRAPCSSPRCIVCSSRARIATAPPGCRITTSPARRGSTCITFTEPWPGSAKRWGRRPKARSRRAASRTWSRRSCSRSGATSFAIFRPCS